MFRQTYQCVCILITDRVGMIANACNDIYLLDYYNKLLFFFFWEEEGKRGGGFMELGIIMISGLPSVSNIGAFPGVTAHP